MTQDDWERLREYLQQFGELDPQFRYIGTSRAGLAKHDYTDARRAEEAAAARAN